MTPSVSAVEAANTTLLILRASEDWAKRYRKDPESFEELLRSEQKFERILRVYFKEMSQHTESLVLWGRYQTELAGMKVAYDIDVIIDEDGFDDQISLLFKIIIDPLYDMRMVGVSAQRSIIDFGVTDDVSSRVSKAARKYAASLAKNLTETTKERIREAIATSLEMGETIPQATARLIPIIDNAQRAETIARTESVRAYSDGGREYAKDTGAETKTWQISVTACPICKQIGELGKSVPIDEPYHNGLEGPPAHPRCNCGEVYNYPEA